MPFTAPTPFGRRSFWSSKPRLDKKAISRPREYVWPEFVALPQRTARDVEIDRLLAEGASFGALGVQLISLHDAKGRDGIVRARCQRLGLDNILARAAEALDTDDNGRHGCFSWPDWGRVSDVFRIPDILEDHGQHHRNATTRPPGKISEDHSASARLAEGLDHPLMSASPTMPVSPAKTSLLLFRAWIVTRWYTDGVHGGEVGKGG
ncbi:hypothetical protein C2E23DRAFT_897618 [Lenzites betulinus]|nr:hypothetical protein C2E23DRAFT_897618 [Lenzites betulinus]